MDYASSILGLLPTGRRSIGITQLLNKLETYLPPAQVDRIRDAYEFGAEAHQGQKRLSGEPYIAHPVAVADLLADLFAPRSGALDVIEQGTPICRCEGVTSGQLQRALAVRSVNADPAALKAVTRVGMGPCQGRICGQLLAQVAARCGATGHPGAFGLPSARPPIKPIKIEALSSLACAHESRG